MKKKKKKIATEMSFKYTFWQLVFGCLENSDFGSRNRGFESNWRRESSQTYMYKFAHLILFSARVILFSAREKAKKNV